MELFFVLMMVVQIAIVVYVLVTLTAIKSNTAETARILRRMSRTIGGQSDPFGPDAG